MIREKTSDGSKPKGTSKTKSTRLYQSVGAITAFADALALIGDLSPERMTVSQTLFFILAGLDDIQGGTPTLTSVKEDMGDALNKSIHSTYGILLPPSERFPKALGWLMSVPNVHNQREKFLHLTPEGQRVMETLAGVLRLQA